MSDRREEPEELKASVILTTKCSEAECRRKELPDEATECNNESLACALLAVGRSLVRSLRLLLGMTRA